MLLRSLSQLNFRNLESPRLELSPGINAIVGHNAAGKSNVLEACHLAATGLSNSKLAEMIRLGESEAFVSISLAHNDGISTIDVGISQHRKIMRLDGQSIKSTMLAKHSSAVLISPEDAELIHGSPSSRRSYVDTLLSKLSVRYAMLSKEYGRVLEQRNAILKRNPHDASLFIWSEKFIELGNEIMALRLRAIKRINDIARERYSDISKSPKTLSISLSSGADTPDLKSALTQSHSEERARGVTVVGPHREDMLLTLDALSLQAYGSRGEARTTALALRVAEYQLLKEKHQEEPLLLIDDFSAELDGQRRNYLLELAANTPQALISGTEAPPRWDKFFTISEGLVVAS